MRIRHDGEIKRAKLKSLIIKGAGGGRTNIIRADDVTRVFNATAIEKRERATVASA